MNQRGNTIDSTSLQPFLDSAANAAKRGQGQFFTPPQLAAALFQPLQRVNIQACTDLHSGTGSLLTASGAEHRLGIDIDARLASGHSRYQADITEWFPLAIAAGFRADLITLNPPFSLQWHSERLAALSRSRLPGLPAAFAAATDRQGHIDSTAASLLMALELSTDAGEGFMICNASTARRMLGAPEVADPEPPLASVRRYLWAWLEIPGMIYQGQHSAFDTAVLYFAAGHGISSHTPGLILSARAASADPETIRSTLARFTDQRTMHRRGRDISSPYLSAHERTITTWKAVRDEYQRLHDHSRPAWNVWLHPDGTIARNLTTFQQISVCPRLIHALNELEGKHPAALVVQQPSRIALKDAVQNGTWRVHPAVTHAVEKAISDYHAVRAPFYPLSPVQSLGYLDEESAITCTHPGIAGIRPGDTCQIRSWIEDTTWDSTRISLAGTTDDITYTGKELVVEVIALDGTTHHFHVRKDETLHSTSPSSTPSHSPSTLHHHPIESLIHHFHIPCPPDIGQLHPERIAALTARLHQIEARINSGRSAVTGQPLPTVAA